MVDDSEPDYGPRRFINTKFPVTGQKQTRELINFSDIERLVEEKRSMELTRASLEMMSQNKVSSRTLRILVESSVTNLRFADTQAILESEIAEYTSRIRAIDQVLEDAGITFSTDKAPLGLLKV